MLPPSPRDRTVRVLVVDDSAFMRKALEKMLSADARIEVIATARNGAEALEVIRSQDPDVVTLDVEMPVMDGLTTLRTIMAETPRPVLMVSSLTTRDADVTLEALALGAVDFIPKQCSFVSLAITRIENELCEKVCRLGRRRHLRPMRPRPASAPPAPPGPVPGPLGNHQAVVIGSSTGGPSALEQLLRPVPRSIGLPILIVQHMPLLFTRSLAERLNRTCTVTVRLAEAGMSVEPGVALVAPGEDHLTVRRDRTGRVYCHLSKEPSDKPHCPSVDVLFRSAADVWGRAALGLVLTGMGHDGLEGAQAIVERGGIVLGQDEASCVVYGMPKAVADAGLVRYAGNLDGLSSYLRLNCLQSKGVFV